MAKKKKPTPTQVDSIRHQDKRKNIPTEELRDFVADDEHAPQTMLYPRDPSLDPQLVWKGKDEQDREDLAVPVVPIYIQEKIHPQAIIDDFKASVPARDDPSREQQLDLFSDFNGLPEEFDQRIDFYRHDANWSNRMILGNSLLVMTSLAEKEGLKGKVQTIYMDPPYGIKFGSNWQVSTRKRDVKDGKAEDVTRQPEQVTAFRDTWKLGIHSYLPYLRDRLVLARELLTETGSVFVQIGDENVHLVRCVLDEVFGSENFCGVIDYKTTSGLSSDFLANAKDYICWFSKNRECTKFRRLFSEKIRGEEGATQFGLLESPSGDAIEAVRDAEEAQQLARDGWKFLAHDNLTSTGFATTTAYDANFNGRAFKLPAGNVRWKTTRDGMQRLIAANRVMLVGSTLRYKRYLLKLKIKNAVKFAIGPTV